MHRKNRFQKSNFLENLALIALGVGIIVASYFPARKIYDKHENYQKIVNGPTVNYSMQKGDNITNLCKQEVESSNLDYNLVDVCRNAVYDINKNLDLAYTQRNLQVNNSLKIPDLNNDGKIGQ